MTVFQLLGDLSDELKQHMLWFYRVTFTDRRRILNVAYTSRQHGCDCHYAFRTAQLNQTVLQQLIHQMELLVLPVAVAVDEVQVSVPEEEEVQVAIVMQ